MTATIVLALAPGRIRQLLADKGDDADWLGTDLREAGIVSVIPGTRSRERPVRYEMTRHKDRLRAGVEFLSLKDSRRVATRYDKLARNDAPAVALVTVVAF